MLFKSNLLNLFFYLYVFICLILLIYHYRKEQFTLTIQDKGIFYILWSGDIESTYRLAQMLIDEGKIVQPLYYNINKQQNSTTNEKIAMNNIIEKLKQEYPLIKINNVKTITDDNIGDNSFNTKFDNDFNKLLNDKKSGLNYLTDETIKKLYIAAKYSQYNNVEVDITFTPEELRNKSLSYLLNNTIELLQKRKNIYDEEITAINYKINDKILNIVSILSKLRIPLLNSGRIRMNKYDSILKLSWSCINPDFRTGKNCGKCEKCIRLTN